MDRLRMALSELIYTRTGRKHISAVSYEAHNLLAPHYRTLSEILDSARLPLDQLSHERDQLSRRRSDLESAIKMIRAQLEHVLQAHIKSTARSFEGLSDYLHVELDAQIRAADLTKEKEASRIELQKSQALQEWATSHGPAGVWEKEFEDFKRTVLNIVQTRLSETDPLGDLGKISSRVDLEQLVVPPSKRYRSGTQDIVQKISGLVGLSAPVLGALAASAGIITGPFVAIPAGIAVASATIYAVIQKNKSNSTGLDTLRKEWIDGLNSGARRYQELFVATVGLRGRMVIDRAVQILSERSYELSRKIILLERRSAEPDIAGRSDLVTRLEPYCKKGEKLLSDLKQLTL